MMQPEEKMNNTFLNEDEVSTLTGRSRKNQQIVQLRTMLLPFWINAQGYPVVPRSAIEGRPEQIGVTRDPEGTTQSITARKKALQVLRFGKPARSVTSDNDSKEK